MQQATIGRSRRSRTLVTIMVCAILIGLAAVSRDSVFEPALTGHGHWTSETGS